MRVLRCSIRSRRASHLSVRWSELVGQGRDVSFEMRGLYSIRSRYLITCFSRRDGSSNRRLCETALGPSAASRRQFNVRQDAFVRQGSGVGH